MSIELVMSAQALVSTLLSGSVYCYLKGLNGRYLAFAGFVVQVVAFIGLLSAL